MCVSDLLASPLNLKKKKFNAYTCTVVEGFIELLHIILEPCGSHYYNEWRSHLSLSSLAYMWDFFD